MDPTDIGLFHIMERRLAWADNRQRLLAQNVANANTPGWAPRDMAAFQPTPTTPVLSASSPLHMQGTGRAAGESSERPRSKTPSGNAVSIEDQLVRVADTAGIQELSLNLHRRYAAMLRIAYGRPA